MAYPTFETEKTLIKTYGPFDYFIGVDEVGFGAIFGELVVCACVLPVNCDLQIKDSKKYSSEDLRTKDADEAKKVAEAWAIGTASARELELIGHGKFTQKLLKQVAEWAVSKYPNSLVVMDGAYPIQGLNHPQAAVIKGDNKVRAVAAASCIAKVARDASIRDLDAHFPEYMLSQNKGYPTKDHLRAIMKYGVTKHHRKYMKPVARAFEKVGVYHAGN